MWKKFIEWRATNDIDNAFVLFKFMLEISLT